MRRVFVRFLGESSARKKRFEINWPLAPPLNCTSFYKHHTYLLQLFYIADNRISHIVNQCRLLQFTRFFCFVIAIYIFLALMLFVWWVFFAKFRSSGFAGDDPAIYMLCDNAIESKYLWSRHGSHRWIIMPEKCRHPDLNVFFPQINNLHLWQLKK